MRVVVGLIVLFVIERVFGHWLLSSAINWPIAGLVAFILLVIGIYLEGQYGNKESGVSSAPEDVPEPVIDEGIDDEVHPIRVPTIRDRMRIRKL